MSKNKIRGISAIAILLITLFSGCNKTNQAPYKNILSAKDELIMVIGSEPDTGFDPTTGWGRYGSPLFQSTLLKRDQKMNIINDLATGYTISTDKCVWTVTLRRDAFFSDNMKLTANDVEYTFLTAKNSGSVLDLNNLIRIKVLDDFTVQFTLAKPQITFINLLISLGIVPQHVHGKDYSEHPIGSGPFKFVQWDKGQQLIVVTNPLYYGKKPFFKRITFLFLTEDAAFAAALAGEVDIAHIPAAFSKQKVPGMRIVSLQSVDNRGIMFPFVKTGKKTKDGYPVGNDITSDPAIRKAINIAIDRQALVNGILEGYGTPASSICDGMPWWNKDTVSSDANPEAARKLLGDAGWLDKDQDGILEKAGVKAVFTLVYPSNDQIRQSLAIAVADKIESIGIQINTIGKSWDEIKTLMHSNAVLFGWGSYDPLEMYNLYSTSQQGNGYYNAGYYSNPATDAYMEQALAVQTEAEANTFWQKAQWDGSTGFSSLGDCPWVWLVNINHLYLVKEALEIGEHKIQPHGHGWPVTDNIAEWYWKL